MVGGSHSGRAFVVGAAVLWGTTGTAQAFAPRGAAPVAVGLARLIVGAAGLLAVAIARRRGELRAAASWAVLPPAVAMAAYQLFFFEAVSTTGVALGTVVAIGTAPVVAGAVGWLLLSERPAGAWFVATFLALVGCYVLLLEGRAVRADPAGIPLAVGAGCSYAAYAVAGKGLVERSSVVGAAAATFSVAALVLLPAAAVVDFAWIASWRGLVVTLHLGLMATTVAYLLFSRGIATTAVATATTLSLAEPLTAALLATAILGERMTASALVAALLVIGSLLILSRAAAGAPSRSL